MSLEELFASARARLEGVEREGLGELVQPRRVLGVQRAPRIVPRGAAWHLGVLLLADDAVLATGDIIRAREEARRGYTAESQRQRAALMAAARRGGFAEGATVHLGWTVLDLAAVAAGAASGPLALVDGVPSVRWSPRGGFAPLEGYLAERVSLLTEPPPGAS
ncbi:glutaminase [Microbacterium sp. SS28]|uniref:glutaminase n=1 Tax=Microbacterium sp. SS28 TaxID=2919948 RepID=UPI001FA999BB|nr:glutaminase [Microbacterium sp. SS28]